MFRLALIVPMLLFLVASVLPVRATGSPDFRALIAPDTVMAHIHALAVEIGARPIGSDAEAQAAAYVAARFEAWGYAVEIREFQTRAPRAGDVTSRNVVATRPGDDRAIIVGAHLDSVAEGTGADDNASGVAAMLAAAEALAGLETTHTLVFIAFGAEENGSPSGAQVYADSLSDDDIANTLAMINIDTVGAGTTLNAYAGAVVSGENDDGQPQIEPGSVWARDLALSLADDMGLPFGTTPEHSWNGFIGAWSDHYPFAQRGVPTVYFEAWDWNANADNPFWGQETPDGDILHTPNDTIENIAPEKVEMVAELVAATVYAIGSGWID